MLKVPDWSTWAYTDGSCHIQNDKQEIGAGPNDAGIINTICRSELAAIAAAMSHSYSHIASDGLTSLHQIRKQLIYPVKHKRHVQKLQSVRTSSRLHVLMVKAILQLLLISYGRYTRIVRPLTLQIGQRHMDVARPHPTQQHMWPHGVKTQQHKKQHKQPGGPYLAIFEGAQLCRKNLATIGSVCVQGCSIRGKGVNVAEGGKLPIQPVSQIYPQARSSDTTDTIAKEMKLIGGLGGSGQARMSGGLGALFKEFLTKICDETTSHIKPTSKTGGRNSKVGSDFESNFDWA
eukprot:1136319-Pelagomonas_calceolata.AAC.4